MLDWRLIINFKTGSHVLLWLVNVTLFVKQHSIGPFFLRHYFVSRFVRIINAGKGSQQQFQITFSLAFWYSLQNTIKYMLSLCSFCFFFGLYKLCPQSSLISSFNDIISYNRLNKSNWSQFVFSLKSWKSFWEFIKMLDR